MSEVRYRWLVVTLLFAAGILNYIDRAALPVIAPLLVRDLGLSPGRLGVLLSTFSVGYAACCFIGGWAADRFGPWRVLAVSVAIWSVFSGLTSLAAGFGSLLVVRLLFGIGEGPYAPATNKLVGQCFPRHEQARAVGFAISGVTLGAAIAGPLIGFVTAATGSWRACFAVIGVLGLVWTAAWLLVVRACPPALAAGMARATAPRASGIADEPGPPALRLSAYLLRPSILAVGFAFFSYSYVAFFFLSWYPTYLSTTYGFDLRTIAWLNSVPWLLGFAGFVSSGILCDAVYRRTRNTILSRKLVLAAGLVMAAVCVGASGAASGVAGSVALMAVAIFFTYLTTSAYWTLILDTVEPAKVGSVSGFILLLSNCGGIVAPLVTGYMVQNTGAFSGAFYAAGLVAVLGAMLVMVVVRSSPREPRVPIGGTTPATVPGGFGRRDGPEI